QLTIREITDRVHRFQLARGRVKADYKPDAERVLRIESSGGVVESRGARFSMLSTGTAVAIATDAGAVTLRAQEGSVEVGEGQQASRCRGGRRRQASPSPRACCPRSPTRPWRPTGCARRSRETHRRVPR